MAKGKFIGGVLVGLIVVGGCTAAMNGSDSGPQTGTDGAKPAAGADSKGAGSGKGEAVARKTQAEEFTDCVNRTGTPTEKAAAKHVVKVTGADKRNDILDNAEVYTDFTGGFMSSNAGDAKLIASAFTSCYESDNGLVTVYGEDGEMIANANF
ncbi:hypothetical protein Stsp02_26240 [Streptomyces sp. NBRC 14336]|uniref:hypothetical protein n=1 Tax=Streptomyces sp. NBRC 14336 TaxID=3030992 RepID=UPI0024A3C13D|nr:hypothetical protein [Streptomyces sp. NBRC 14336]WBO76350.1 hypothetical protein SBE_007118 [Streptomyces sp. SBE_14.2]GLW46962.1 hypothetical protein Stsp02_26240 [Streptomyces sp. NBRC 14336]